MRASFDYVALCLIMLHYFDRKTGQRCTETIFMESALRFFYEHPLGIWLFDHGLNYPWICWLCAQWQSLPGSKRRILPFIIQHQIDPTEFATEIADFAHFNAFFSRRLKPNTRPFEAPPQILQSPADGKILVYLCLCDTTKLPVKGIGFSLAALLQSAELAAAYHQGAAAIIRLTPADYHRFHFPSAATAGRSQLIRGGYHSVHPIALNRVPDAFCRNQRSITQLDSPVFGPMLMVEVGAFGIGTIRQTYRPGKVKAGQEKGFFQFGGSTIVLLFQRDRIQFDPDLIQHSAAQLETQIKAGNPIGQAVGA
jgi:phosphatidylserine decarboxylase